MILTNLATLALNFVLFANGDPPKAADGQEQGGGTPDKSLAALNAWLARFPGLPRTEKEGRTVVPVDDAAVRRAFPGERFYGVYFYLNYPRPQSMKGGMRTHNLFLVADGGAVERIGEREALKALFEKKLPPARDEAQAREAASACLRVAEEFYQDGLYKFADPEVKVARRDLDLVATAQAKVKEKGTGTVSVTLTFKPSGPPAGVEIEGRVRPDVRRR